MKADNTPTVIPRSRNLTAQKRLRKQEAKKLEGIAAKARAKREVARLARAEGIPATSIDSSTIKIPNIKKNTLTKPPKAVSKFRKRQIHKQWLPTHLYHAKRAHMTPPKEPLWRFAIPLTPTEKSYRATHRASCMRGCMVWDMSYMSTIGLEGNEASLLGVLRCLGVSQDTLISTKGAKWRRGVRSWKGWIRERDGDAQWIAKVDVVWCSPGRNQDEGAQEGDSSIRSKKGKRKLLIRVHPSAFLQLWTETLKVSNMQRPQVSVEDLRFEIGSIEIMGPGATESLVGVLRPTKLEDSPIKRLETSEKIWPSLAAVTNPASLPAHAILDFDISDPRLHHPPRTVPMSTSPSVDEDLLQTLSAWPPDDIDQPSRIFSRAARHTASRTLPSQKAINRRKGLALPGAYPTPLPTDPIIPVLLLASRPEIPRRGQGSWTLLLPWKCVVPVWYSLMYYPLSTGETPRFGGLKEKRQILFEQAMPWFPGDFPGTKAGWEWEMGEREKRKAEWATRPKGKRIEWDSLDLGRGRKGEIGNGWACDWERLFGGPPVIPPASAEGASQPPGPPSSFPATSPPAASAPATPPLNIHHVPLPFLSTLPDPPPPTSLATVSITLLHRGVPQTCGRIYRLPTNNPALRAQWLALSTSSSSSTFSSTTLPHQKPPADAPAHTKRAALAASLLTSPPKPPTTTTTTATPQTHANDPSYPLVPDEIDLIGFVTTGNFNLGEGRGTGVGCIALARVRDEAGKVPRDGLCVVREAGRAVGRVARWRVV